MASSRDDCKANYYHQTMELHLGFGTEVLRRIIESYLSKMGLSLKDYLNQPSVNAVFQTLKQKKPKPVLFQSQWDLLYPTHSKEPNLSHFDITLLTLLLLSTSFNISTDERRKVIELKTERNYMSHLPKPELNDKAHFNIASKLVTELSGTVSHAFTKEIKQNIAEIQGREFVRCRSTLDVLSIRNEELMIVLIDRPDGKTVDESDATYLKYGLTKWADQVFRTIQLDNFMTQLKNNGVLSYTEKLEIEKEYNKEEQYCKLVMKMMDETNENIFKFCKCLRSVDENLANLVENRSSVGEKIDEMLRKIEDDKILLTLRKFIKEDKTGKATSEKVHLLVEKQIGYVVQYSHVEQLLQETFNIKQTDFSYAGIALTDMGEEQLAGYTAFENASGNISCTTTEEKGSLANMSYERLAQYICEQCDMVKAGIGKEMKNALVNECIKPEIFMMMTKDDIKECFEEYITEKIPYGILKLLETIQRQIQRETSVDIDETMALRKFDSLTGTVVYKKCQVSPPDGNLLTPVHEFRTLPHKGEMTLPYMIKESIKFIDACINSRKNGTLHFGIEGISKGIGSISGINRFLKTDVDSMNVYLTEAIESCFGRDQSVIVKRCIRPFQAIPVDDGSIVLEFDVVPFSGYTKSEFFWIMFPPKGKQEKKLFVYSSDHECEIFEVQKRKEDKVKELYKEVFQQRRHEEYNFLKNKELVKSQTSRLVLSLTAGSDFVTDQFTPIICCGKMTGCKNECDVRQQFDVPEALMASVSVFDFDSSVSLRNQVEKDDAMFQVITADDINSDETILANSDRMWIYCNGNVELGSKEMNLHDWYKHRFNSVKNLITLCGKKTPRQRALLIVLAFCKCGTNDPLSELVADCIKSNFRDQCVVIAASEEVVVELKESLAKIMSEDEVTKYLHTGMSWVEISDTLRTVFRPTSETDYKLPCSNGHFVIMTAEEKRKLNFTDIEILGGEECKRIEERDDNENRRKRKLTEQENFYKGGDVTWWNFYYQDQVGKRDFHSKFLRNARDKLQLENNVLIEVLKIRHQPGAGGSTAGRFILWQLSQFEHQEIRHTYRCCVVKQITEDTANQINRFLWFKDDTPKPVVFVTDNENEENLRQLLSRLNVLAYKHVEAGKLFCLHVEVNRVSVSYSKDNEIVLKHALSKPEQTWFETKYRQLENSDVDVETLISFNVMRKSFDKKYIKQLVERIMRDIRDTEMDVLKCLSLINTFNRDNVIPISTFDCLVAHDKPVTGRYPLRAFKDKGPIGLVVPMMGDRTKTCTHRLWNVDVTEELALLIKRGSTVQSQNGVMLISQALAKAVLNYIMKNKGLGLRDIVEFVFSIVEQHANESNPESKYFVKVVSSLFTTRPILSAKAERRSMFSDLILALQQKLEGENTEEANLRVIELMERHFKIASDALVGQQLARFFMSVDDFKNAERTISRSLELMPNSPYLLSTYGQVYKKKMEYSINHTFSPISDSDASHIIDTMFQALNKFISGQKYAKSTRELDLDNTCFAMEVKTYMGLLDKFYKFSCFEDMKNFHALLNQPHFDLENSSFKDLAQMCALSKLQKGSGTQKHMEESLRRIEEKEYQIKRYVYKADKFINDMELVNLRNRFEKFYGTAQKPSEKRESYIKGLKSIMKATIEDKHHLQGRVVEIEEELQHMSTNNTLETVDTDRLHVLLGYEIVQMSVSDPNSQPMCIEKYKRLLQYSEILLDCEQSSSRAYLEAFLYYAILNWPSQSRLQKVDSICKPSKYKHVLKIWKKNFDNNFSHRNKGKNYYVFGKGDLGCDIVDLDECRKEWVEMKLRDEKRIRPPVFDDNFWKTPFVVEKVKRLAGRSDSTGNSIEYQSKYQMWEYILSIKAYYPCPPTLRNRRVTFVLGFTWEGLAAFDVEEEIKQTETPVGETKGQTYDESLHGVFDGLISDQELQQPKNTVGGTEEIFDDSHLGAVGGASLHRGSSDELVAVVDVTGSPSAKQQSPVEMLNEIMKDKHGLKHVDYQEVQQTGKTGGFAFWVCIEDYIYEGKGSSKTLARQDTARNALRDHFKIHLEPSGPERIAATKATERRIPQNRKNTKHKLCQNRKKRT